MLSFFVVDGWFLFRIGGQLFGAERLGNLGISQFLEHEKFIVSPKVTVVFQVSRRKMGPIRCLEFSRNAIVSLKSAGCKT